MPDEKSISVELVRPPNDPPPRVVSEWEQFVSECPSVHLEQLWTWGDVRRVDGWEPALLTLRDDGFLRAGALILVRRVKRVLKIGYVCRGPLLKPQDGDDETAWGMRVAGALRDAARRLGVSYLVVAPPYDAGRLPECLRAVGCAPHLPRLPPSGLMNAALLIDLAPSEDDLMMSFRRTLRQDIRKGERGGITVREGDERDIELLWKLMIDLCRRRGTQSNVSDIEVMRRLWRALHPGGRVRMDVAEAGGKPVVALMTVCLGAWAIPWRIGWAGDERKLSPEKCLYWSVLRDVRRRGCTVFDFNWVDTREVEAIRSGGALPASTHAGITFFKMGFGGRVVPVPDTIDYFPNPLVRTCMRSAGRALLGASISIRNRLRRTQRPA